LKQPGPEKGKHIQNCQVPKGGRKKGRKKERVIFLQVSLHPSNFNLLNFIIQVGHEMLLPYFLQYIGTLVPCFAA